MKPTHFFLFKTKKMCYSHTFAYAVNLPHQLHPFISMTSTQKPATQTYSCAVTHTAATALSHTSQRKNSQTLFI